MIEYPRRRNIQVVIVTGGRDYADSGELWAALSAFKAWVPDGCLEIWQGACPTGTDFEARSWARHHGVMYRSFPADWDNITRPGAVVRTRRGGKKYDAAAGPARNKKMMATSIAEGYSAVVLATKGGDGTRNAIACAVDHGIEVIPLETYTSFIQRARA